VCVYVCVCVCVCVSVCVCVCLCVCVRVASCSDVCAMEADGEEPSSTKKKRNLLALLGGLHRNQIFEFCGALRRLARAMACSRLVGVIACSSLVSAVAYALV
jgi:hypothetical protein